MASIDIFTMSGGKAGTFELAEEVFGAVNEDLLWEAITHYRASARAGTHATKNRWRVSGSGKKLWKQKGTGRARIGSIRSPLWRHGGTVHGPQPRSYDYAFPKKKLLGALRSALASKFADGKLIVVKAFDVKEPKTKLFREAMGKWKVDGTTLLVDNSTIENKNLALSSRNIDGLELVRANEVHPYHIMRYTHVVFAQPALEKLQDSLKKSASRRSHEAEPAEEHEETKKKKPAARRGSKTKSKAKAKVA
jgi:large subunit ribosomal protein L4